MVNGKIRCKPQAARCKQIQQKAKSGRPKAKTNTAAGDTPSWQQELQTN
jgi:hypothetical protein